MATITGTILDDVLATTAAADVLTALNGNDVVLVALAAGHGAGESLDGGAGYDRLWFTSSAAGTLVLRSTVTNFESIQIVDEAGNAFGTALLNLDASALSTGVALTGNDGANSITGTARDDVLVGGGGEDSLGGGLGNDRVVMGVAAGDTDQVNAGIQTEGNTLILVGAAPAVALIDLMAADQLVSFDLTADAPVQSGFSHVDASGVGGYGVRITGAAGRNVLIGSAQDDVFVVANALHHISTDAVSGGFGDDVLRFSSTTALQTLVLNANLVGVERAEIADASGDASGGMTLGMSAAAVRVGMTLAGNEGANTLIGTAFNDSLYGNGGADSLAGGAGNDIYFYDNASDGVAGDRITDALGTADYIAFTDTLAGATLVLGASMTGIEGIYAMGLDSTGAAFDFDEVLDRNLNGSALAATLGMRFYGNAGVNALTGGKGKDTLTGNDGVDSIVGGLGADLVVMDVNAASIDVIDAGDALEGNTLRLVGSATDPALIDLGVAAGADQLLEINGGAELLVQSDFTHVDASDLAGAGVTITGSALANSLIGSAQQDVFVVLTALHFGSADRIDGRGEDDTLRFASTIAGQALVLGSNVVAVERVDIADATGDATGTTTLSLNAAARTAGILLAGNAGRNTLTGGTGADTLMGNGGIDFLAGGAGDDEYRYDNAADFVVGERITELSGTDTLRFASIVDGALLTLSASVTGIELFVLDEPEEDTVSGADIGLNAAALGAPGKFLGNEGNNTITGTRFADRIEGGKGFDSIVGGLGTDTIVVSVDALDSDVAIAGAYTENNIIVLTGEDGGVFDFDLSIAAGSDQSTALPGMQSGFTVIDGSRLTEASLSVTGSIRGDSITGGAKTDIFAPGLGTDTLQGGGEDDYYVVTSQAELGADIYNDSGGTPGDYILFDSTVNGATLNIHTANVNGVDAAATSFSTSSTVNLNINASTVTRPFGLAGNAGRNVLTSTFNGESLFDYGGADTMNGGLGDDDYVIVVDWVHGGPGVGDRINDTGGLRDDLYNATNNQVIIVNPAMITGIERFVVSSANLAEGGTYVRDIEVFNDAGFDLNLWGRATHLAGSWGDNYLRGTRFGDSIYGSQGEDTVIGGLGADYIFMQVGGGDIDQVDAGLTTELNQWILSGVPDGTVVVNLGVAEGADQLLSIDGVADTLVQSGFRHINASGVSTHGVEIRGSAAVNTIYGSGQDDVLDGAGGADKLYAGPGNDAFVVSAVADYVAGDLFDGGEGNDAVRFASTVAGQTFGLLRERLDSVEIIAIADAAGDASGTTALNINAAAYDAGLTLIGNEGDNSITGTNFADTIIGNGGADTLRGNAGNDIYLIEAPGELVAGDSIVDTAGTDILRFVSVTDGETALLTALMSGLDIAEASDAEGALTGVFDLHIDASAVLNGISLRGNDGDNLLTGSAFNDTINGNGGRDSLLGGAGADRFLMDTEAVNIDDVDGGAIAEGNTLVLLEDPGSTMVWDLSTGADQLISVDGADEGRTVLGITHIDASGLEGASVTITGSAEANTLIGSADNDLFIVLASAHFAPGESINGGGGTADVLRFTSTSGGETLLLTGLVSGIESLQISDAAGLLTGTTALNLDAAAVGNALKIEGNAGANALTGGALNDTIVGGGGVDTILAGGGADEVRVQMSAGNIDSVDAGAATEGNRLVLSGAAAGAAVINLSLAGDQMDATGEALVQSGFMHLDASGMTGFGVTVTGSSGNNSIVGTAQSDVINAGLGADAVSMNVATGSDAINAGALAEGNSLLLIGAAGGTVTVDLSAAGDQVSAPSESDIQSGFTHLDASAMTGFGVDVTGSSAANSITGSAQVDTINGGAGADRIVWNASTAPDVLDGGSPADGDTLVLKGNAAGVIVLDYAVAPGADQIAADAAVQANFQHLDAAALTGNGVNARGNGLNNSFIGSDQADRFSGLAGADSIWLGGGDGVDAAADKVVYERPQDGINAAGAAFSFDRIREFKTGQDDVIITGAFNGGPNDLDDIDDDTVFQFATDAKANFSLDHEAMLITAATSRLTTATSLSASNFGAVVIAINRLGVIAATGDDGLIVVQSTSSTGVYYYQELDGILNKVAAGELTLLGVFDATLGGGDLALL